MHRTGNRARLALSLTLQSMKDFRAAVCPHQPNRYRAQSEWLCGAAAAAEPQALTGRKRRPQTRP